MPTGRTLNRFIRVYIDGYDMSGYGRSIGPLSVSFDEGRDDAFSATIISTLLGQGTMSPGTLNALFDNTATSGAHAVLGTAGVTRVVMVAQGIQAAPAQGDPVYAGQFLQKSYLAVPAENPSAVTVEFGAPPSNATTLQYFCPWGLLLHPNLSTSDVNSSVGVDQGQVGTSDSSSDGGFMTYEVLDAVGAGNITATIKVQDAAVNADGSFADLLSSGVINCGAAGVAVPTKGIVALAKDATVRRYVRWQIVFGTATSVIFVLSFHRNFAV